MFRLSLLHFGIFVIGVLGINDNKRDNYYDKDANKYYNEESFVYENKSCEEYEKKSYEKYQEESYEKYETKSNEECKKESNEECEKTSNDESSVIVVLGAKDNTRNDFRDIDVNKYEESYVKYDKEAYKKYEKEFDEKYEEKSNETSNEKFKKKSYKIYKEKSYIKNKEEFCKKYEEQSSEEYEINNTFDYFLQMNMIDTLINNFINPCADFYNYTCELWDQLGSMVPASKNYNQNKIYFSVNKLLKDESKFNQLPFIKMAKQLYQSCMDEDTIEEKGLKPMQELLDATGGWPILMSDEEWNAKHYTWQLVHNAYFKLYSFSILFDISYQTDYANSDIFMIRPFPQNPLGKKLKIDIQQSLLSFDIKILMQLMLNKTGEWPKYMKTIMEVVRAFAKDKGIKISEEKLHMNVIELIEFEIKLEKIIKHKKKIHEIIPTTGEKMTIAQLQEYYNLAGPRLKAKIDWLHTIQITFAKLFKRSISSSETVLVFHKKILHDLAYLLDATPEHVIVNYLQWHVVRIFMSNLNKEMRSIESEYYYSHDIYPLETICYETKLKRRWLQCIEEFQMKDALSYLYVKTYISRNNMQAVSRIFKDVKEEMINYMKYLMKQNKLLANLIIQKIYNISLHINYPEWYNNETLLAQVYKGLKIDDNYFMNVLAIIKYKNLLRSRNFRESKYRDESLYRWTLDFLSDNPNYDEQSNVISIPAAMMNYPYFVSNAAIAANYGAIGSTFGQLLVRSAYFFIESYFDDYDNLRLKTVISQAFEEGSRCLMKHYDNFIPHLTINENPKYIKLYKNLVRDEIIAHTIGIQVAFAAFEKRKTISLPQLDINYQSYKTTFEDISAQPELETMNFTQEQLFFIYNTLLICNTKNPYENFINITSIRAQIIDNLVNIWTFPAAFNCPFYCINAR
ncbi:membrane metallo-endopeptidase-like 1 [Nylanderia fulva]|uniref:membrane metallo-endopeptidase-like 1 n=1 Tax=Nylanderia fulva TaxID=613905 RepID=UPI0010FB00C4|nr:membrane metallo-endopeptidase-like 1 [Nylanderia fulva]